MEKLLRDFLKGYAALGVVGLLVAVGLLLATRWLLPKKDRRLLRVPIFFLFVHVGALAAGLFTPAGSSLKEAVGFVALLALLLGAGRLVGVLVSVVYEVPPHRVHQAILEAIRDAPGVLASPPPSVVTNAFGDNGIEYWVRFFTEAFDKRDGVDGGVRDRIYYALHRQSFTIPIPQRNVHVHQISDESRARDDEGRIAKRERALRAIELLRVLDPALLRRLAALASTRLFSPGETVVRQGDDADELYIIERGVVAVLLEAEGQPTSEVTRLGPGMFFGEMALMTGERRQATVRAVNECELMVIGHEHFHGVLAESPHLVKQLSHVLAERQTMLDEHADALSADDREREVNVKSLQLLDRIKNFFEL